MITSTTPSNHASATILDILNNSVVLKHLAPYLPIRDILAFSRSCKSVRDVFFGSPEAFRYLDLSPVKSAVKSFDSPIDSGGINWRSQRMDESLTEDDFYAGPLRGVFSKLSRQHVLKHVQTLILDGLSVPADLVQEIISDAKFNVRILSLREARHLNERKLMQVLKYAVRPSRPQGTPKLKGLYVFGPVDSRDTYHKPETGARMSSASKNIGVTSTRGAQIGVSWNERSYQALTTSLTYSENRWYQPTGRVLRRPISAEWGDILKACEGIIAFDAVLCRGPRHDSTTIGPDANTASGPWLRPSVATIALGPNGCAKCGTSPEGPAEFGTSPDTYLPLLAPPPLHTSSVRAAQNPSVISGQLPPPIFIRCEDCLHGRWCERCFKWWDESCYSSSLAGKRFPEVGVARDCFGCGRTCGQCKDRYIRRCKICRSEFCIVDNAGGSLDECDWCHHTGRRTRELY